jgi:hypothetical protein
VDPNSVTLTDLRIFRRIGHNYILDNTAANLEISELVAKSVFPASSKTGMMNQWFEN